MQKIWQYKKYLLFVTMILVIGIITGLIYYRLLDEATKSDIIYTLNNLSKYHYNGILKDLTIMAMLLVTSFLVIGLPLSIFYLFYESVAIGFLISAYLAAFKIKGLILASATILINKLIPLILIIFFLPRIFNISRYIIGLVIYQKDSSIVNKIIVNFKNALYIIVFTLVFNILLYFITPSVFNYLMKII